MKTMKKYLLLIAMFFLLSNCDSIGRNRHHVASNISLTADSIKINYLLNLNQIFCIKDFLIIESDNTADLYYFFTLPEMQFAFSFGNKGQGPDEFLFNHGLIESPSSNAFFIADNGNKEIRKFEIGDSITEIKSFSLKDMNKMIPNDIHFMSSEIFCFQNRTPGKTIIESWDFAHNEQSQYYDLSQNSNSILDDGLLSSSMNRIVYAYSYQDRISILHEGKQVDIRNQPITVNEQKMTHYYAGVQSDEKYIVVLYIGASEEEILSNLEHFVSKVHIYNWEGDFLCSFELDRFISKFSIDFKQMKMYSYSPLNEDYIYTYNIKIPE